MLLVELGRVIVCRRHAGCRLKVRIAIDGLAAVNSPGATVAASKQPCLKRAVVVGIDSETISVASLLEEVNAHQSLVILEINGAELAQDIHVGLSGPTGNLELKGLRGMSLINLKLTTRLRCTGQYGVGRQRTGCGNSRQDAGTADGGKG